MTLEPAYRNYASSLSIALALAVGLGACDGSDGDTDTGDTGAAQTDSAGSSTTAGTAGTTTAGTTTAGTTTAGTTTDSTSSGATTGVDTTGTGSTGADTTTGGGETGGGDQACGDLPAAPQDMTHDFGGAVGPVTFVGTSANCGIVVPGSHTLSYSIATAEGIVGPTLSAQVSLIGGAIPNLGELAGKSVNAADAAVWQVDYSPGVSQKKYVGTTMGTFHLVELSDTVLRGCITGAGQLDTSPPSGVINTPDVLPIVCNLQQ